MAVGLIPALVGGGAAAAGGLATTLTTVAGIGGPILSGLGAAKQARGVAAQQAAQARAAEVRGLEVEASLRDELLRTLSGFNAARGANGLSITSPTGAAIAGDIRKFARQDYLTQRRNTAQQVAGMNAQAKSTLASGRMSLLTGGLQAAPSFLSLLQG